MSCVGLSSVFHMSDRIRPVSSIPHLSSHAGCLSLMSRHLFHFPVFSRQLGLNDGVPVEVVLDVIGSEHTSHLEMSRRQCMLLLLLLAELTVMACHTGSCVAHGGHVGVSSWWAHQRGNVLSRVHVHVPCADVLVVLSVLTVLAGLRVHGPVGLSRVLRYPWRCRVLDLRLRLWVGGALRGDDPCGGEELVDGRTQICHLSGVQ